MQNDTYVAVQGDRLIARENAPARKVAAWLEAGYTVYRLLPGDEDTVYTVKVTMDKVPPPNDVEHFQLKAGRDVIGDVEVRRKPEDPA